MPCSMRGGLTTSSGMEAPAEKMDGCGAGQLRRDGAVGSRGAARAAHRAAAGNPPRPELRKLAGSRSDRDRITFAAEPAAKHQRGTRGALPDTNLSPGSARQPDRAWR